MNTMNYDFDRFVDLMARLLEKYADKVDVSDIEIGEEELKALHEKLKEE